MPKYLRTFLAAASVAFVAGAAAADAPDDKAIYDRILSLAGDWTGHMEDPLSGPQVSLRYETVSGGKAVIEHQSPSGSLPAVTVYFLADGKLAKAAGGIGAFYEQVCPAAGAFFEDDLTGRALRAGRCVGHK